MPVRSFSNRSTPRRVNLGLRSTVFGAALAVVATVALPPVVAQDASERDPAAIEARDATLELAPDQPPASDDPFERYAEAQQAAAEAGRELFIAIQRSMEADRMALEAAVSVKEARDLDKLTSQRRELAEIRLSVERERMSDVTVRAYVSAGDFDIQSYASLLDGDTSDPAGGQELMFSQVMELQEKLTTDAAGKLDLVVVELLVVRGALRKAESELADARAVAAERTADKAAATRARDEAKADVDRARAAFGTAPRGQQVPLETALIGLPRLSADDLATWFEKSTYRSGIPTPMSEMAAWFISEGAAEGIRGDVAFAQAVLETGGFTNTDSRRANNYSGIGHCDSCPAGWTFPSPQMGVRAQIQLLKSYAVAKPQYANPLVDRRLRGPAGCCNTWGDLTTVWATDPGYGPKVMLIYSLMVDHSLNRRAAGIGFEEPGSDLADG